MSLCNFMWPLYVKTTSQVKPHMTCLIMQKAGSFGAHPYHLTLTSGHKSLLSKPYPNIIHNFYISFHFS